MNLRKKRLAMRKNLIKLIKMMEMKVQFPNKTQLINESKRLISLTETWMSSDN